MNKTQEQGLSEIGMRESRKTRDRESQTKSDHPRLYNIVAGLYHIIN